MSLVGLGGCSAYGVAEAQIAGPAVVGPASAPEIPTPLATSVQTSQGTWATLPMGRLDEPLNTFWQLFYRPSTAMTWSNKVEATATNGGLVLATTGARLLVGVRPSVDLVFTPLISTSDGGRSWSDGLVTRELAAHPDALAMSKGQALALVDRGTRAQVWAGTGSISRWRRLVTYLDLGDGKAGRSCGLGSLTSVGYLGAHALVGASCGRPGVVGLFARYNRRWRLVGPTLPPAFDDARAEVLGLGLSHNVTSVLVGVTRTGGTDLLAAWSGPGATWSTSLPLPVPQNEQVASFGAGYGKTVFAVLQGPSGRERLAVAEAERPAWRALPSPPAGTQTVAFGPGASIDALVATGTRFSAWSLPAGSTTWAEDQVMNVPIQYGSSS